MDIEATAREEIARLHTFFEDWFNGEVEQTPEAFDSFASVMADGFVLVGRDGEVTPRGELLDAIWEHWGHPADEGRRIEIDTDEVKLVRSETDTHLALYVEEQTVDGDTNVRRSSALFRINRRTPVGLEWLYVQESPMG